MIEFRNIWKTYTDGTEAVKNFSLTIRKGEIVTLIGPSGCGKTTSLKMINRLIEPTAGSIYIDNQDIKTFNIDELRWNIGYVLQEIALFPHLTIAENISVVPEMMKWKRKKVKKRCEDLLDMVGLEPSTYMDRMPHELSGGQQQRVGVVRALAADPDIILMDEPFSALDPISREQLQEDIRRLQKEIEKTIVFVTHDMDEALAIGDQVCLMKEGEIVQYDQPQQLIVSPKNQFVKDFIGEKKSPWHTAVDVIAQPADERVITETFFDNGAIPHQGLYAVCDKSGLYLGAVQDGEPTAVTTLDNHLPLIRAADMVLDNKQEFFPVLKQDKLVGILSHDQILSFLKDEELQKNGGLTSE
ncbi:ABC transporter ATP-binding protein [Virgibacillus xinjiangensis]|uniref:ABC transporter ATP-binding protein n=1 Tax=Virgibacillus xinjiangensis TaxID=393090 RepID=A0ABV7CR12_9BACI